MYTYRKGNSAFLPLHPTICIKISFFIDTTVNMVPITMETQHRLP